MQLVAGLGIIFFLLLTVIFWKIGATEQQLTILSIVTVVSSIVLYFTATFIGNYGMTRANKLVEGIQNIKKGDLTRPISISGKSDFSWMAFELDSARKNVSTLVNTLMTDVKELESATDNVSTISSQTVEGVLQQQNEISQVASAMTTMAASVQEVAATAANTAEAARNADNEAQAGKEVVTQAMDAINTLASEVERAAQTLNDLEADIGNIGAIVDVIRGITEQTNLLALNAAIEAARAGEHGRGFAVVADEVRTLAARTQSSTHEIEEMVGRLQGGARAAVAVMSEGRESAKTSVEKAASAGEALDKITAMITTMDKMSEEISGAVNEQTSVADGINKGIVKISKISELTATGAQESSAAVDKMAALAVRLQEAASKFKV
ncbi:MAG: chemotaxis protein [Gammaproteobacteria bacterium]|nr:MAG: chemotaxis protein [Gammaproteobacteria bacterium]